MVAGAVKLVDLFVVFRQLLDDLARVIFIHAVGKVFRFSIAVVQSGVQITWTRIWIGKPTDIVEIVRRATVLPAIVVLVITLFFDSTPDLNLVVRIIVFLLVAYCIVVLWSCDPRGKS